MERKDNIKLIFMKLLKVLPLLLLLMFVTYSAKANRLNSKYDSLLYQSYKDGDMEVWVNVMKLLENEYESNPQNPITYDLLKVQYGYIGYLIGINDTKSARKYLAKAESNTEKLLKAQSDNADVIAIKAALVAYNIGLSPYKAPFLGPRSMSLIDEALAINPNSIQALIEKANATHYAPSMFGGNPEEAVKYYSKALQLMELNYTGKKPISWIYLNIYVQLALAQEKAGQIANAQRTYARIISMAPDFKWVVNDLYPKFSKKHKLK